MAKKKNKNQEVAVVNDDNFMINKKINDIEFAKVKLYDEVMKSGNPDMIMKATNYLTSSKNGSSGSQIKSMLIDPLDFASSFGYKDRPTNLSYGMLRRMSKTPFTAMTINTRIAQISKFCVPQEDEYTPGFKIKLRDRNKKPNKQEQLEMDEITKFIENGGKSFSWGRDDFEKFVAKIIRDSLSFDQYTFEILENRKGVPQEFIATDASTYRIAFPERRNIEYANDPLTGEKCPSMFVQIYQGNIEQEFFPWELCFGIRRPRTDLAVSGYGYSELEELVNIVTSMLYSDEYNRKFFSQGSAPKGILRVSGTNISDDKLKEFKRSWQMQMAGVANAWKTPVMEADKIDWIDLTKTNRDMEFSSWQEYLIKLHSALFLIDASELGFDISKGRDQKTMFESNSANRLKYSKDKGLTPLLRNVSKSINKHVVWRISDKYEFVFVGEDSLSEEEALDRAIKEVTNFKQIDEIRAKFDLKPLGEQLGGNLILNPNWMSWYNNMLIAKQNQQQDAMNGDGGMGEDDFGEEQDSYDPVDEEQVDDGGADFENANKNDLNPFVKDLEQFLLEEKV